MVFERLKESMVRANDIVSCSYFHSDLHLIFLPLTTFLLINTSKLQQKAPIIPTSAFVFVPAIRAVPLTTTPGTVLSLIFLFTLTGAKWVSNHMMSACEPLILPHSQHFSRYSAVADKQHTNHRLFLLFLLILSHSSNYRFWHISAHILLSRYQYPMFL